MASIVAIAGGTGDLGRTIVEAILADRKFSVVILSREANDDREKEIGARILPVDYSSADDIARVLEENNVHTVISTLNNMASVEPELNLIAAADQAAATKRYVPSIWGAKFSREYAEEMPIIKPKILIIDALEKTSLEFSAWYTGYFADYYVCPPLKSHIKNMAMVVDVVNNKAGIPGSGDVPVAMTFTADLAKFVAAALTLPKWEQEVYLVGDRLAWNQLVELAEAVKGVKFDVTYDTIETLRTGTVTKLPRHRSPYPYISDEQLQPMFATLGLMFERGVFDVKAETSITRNFPDLKLRSMKELLEEAYKLEG
ncbi:hypothetical protein CaCOL14_012189 [Colletotrichum acutatum]|uniref:NmrA-like domain-containing protein n=1 Tax=Glomerella acutata TaxID=27357 RepID=A0AAD8XHH1_GLOAC|nr:uncharacterized protein BDZ83DRAFT_750852 [Colletotrichum acutatum]KAK1726481.1 hypothetical protein BDZ83DRAFT_750852 [Colletotrichum acutatum]